MPHCVACNIKLSPATEVPFVVDLQEPSFIFYTCASADCVADALIVPEFRRCKQKMA